MSKKSVEEKKLDFERRNGLIKEVSISNENKTKLKNVIKTMFLDNELTFEYLEDLKDHVKRLNPLLMKRFNLEQEGILRVEEFGSKSKIIFN